MDLPQTQNKEDSRRLWKEEILALKAKKEERFRVKITDDDLKRAIRDKNRERALLKEFYELSKETPPPMTWLQQLHLLFGAQYKFDQAEKLVELRKTIDNVKKNYAQGSGRFRPRPNGSF